MFGFGKMIDVKEITSELKENTAQLVDVRGNEEWDESHAEGALHLSVERILNGEVPTRDKSKKIYLYCASGGRASMAASRLRASGYVVENLGGLRDWKTAGGTTELGM